MARFFCARFFERYSKAQGLFYALMALLAVAYIATATLRTQGLNTDTISNAHLKYQSSLYAQSILEMAKLCLQAQNQCSSDEFVFDNEYSGGYNLFNAQGGYEIHIYVLSLNQRTSQVNRTFLRVYLPFAKK